MRNHEYLQSRLDSIITNFFPEIDNSRITIIFGRRARTRLGSIKQPKSLESSVVTINGIFADESIPTEIIDATIAHELCHYIHGFSSSLPQLLSHPHRGGVVNTEIRNRGLGHILDFQTRWLKTSWPSIVKSHFPNIVRRRRRIRFVLFR